MLVLSKETNFLTKIRQIAFECQKPGRGRRGGRDRWPPWSFQNLQNLSHNGLSGGIRKTDQDLLI